MNATEQHRIAARAKIFKTSNQNASTVTLDIFKCDKTLGQSQEGLFIQLGLRKS